MKTKQRTVKQEAQAVRKVLTVVYNLENELNHGLAELTVARHALRRAVEEIEYHVRLQEELKATRKSAA
jgi:hypothetical protein